MPINVHWNGGQAQGISNQAQCRALIAYLEAYDEFNTEDGYITFDRAVVTGGWHASTTTGGTENEDHLTVDLDNAALRQQGDSFRGHWTRNATFTLSPRRMTRREKEKKAKRKGRIQDKKRERQRRDRRDDDDKDQDKSKVKAREGDSGRETRQTQTSSRGGATEAGGYSQGGGEGYSARRSGYESHDRRGTRSDGRHDTRGTDGYLRPSGRSERSNGHRSPGYQRESYPVSPGHHSSKTRSGHSDHHGSHTHSSESYGLSGALGALSLGGSHRGHSSSHGGHSSRSNGHSSRSGRYRD